MTLEYEYPFADLTLAAANEVAIVVTKSRLRHSWLENQILNRDPVYVAQRHRESSSARDAFEEKIQPGGEFDRALDDARELCARVVDACSPTQLVNSRPLAELPERTRHAICGLLEAIYLRECSITEVRSQFTAAIECFSGALCDFSGAWYREPLVDPVVVNVAFVRLQRAGADLHGVLGRLPGGIILP